MDDRRRVVLVDDLEIFRELLRIQFEETGRYVIVGEAGDGAAAVDVAREQQPDVIMLDETMPGISGSVALPQIRAAAPRSMVVLITGHDAGKVDAPDADLILSKIDPPPALVRKVDDILQPN